MNHFQKVINFVAFSLLFGSFSFSEQSGYGSSIQFDQQGKKEYLQSQKQHFLSILGCDSQDPVDATQLGKNIVELITENYAKDGIEWNKEPGKLLDLSALCYAAADIQCPTPIALFPELFDHSIFAYEKYYGNTKVDDRLEDYPFMFLAVQCGQRAVPLLREMILNKECRAELRVKAVATLMKIDTDEAQKSAMEMMDESTDEIHTILSLYLKNPTVEPWDVIPLFSSRGRSITERKQQSSR